MRIARVALCAGCFAAFALSSPSRADTAGSPLISRQFTDVDLGQVDIYVGSTSPFQQTGNVSSWSFFDDRNFGGNVTPVIFHIDASGKYSVTGIGTTRSSTAGGLQTYSFGLIAGSDAVTSGAYTFGFTDRAYTTNQSGLVAGVSNAGVISFDRPSQTIPNDPWDVTAGATSGGPVTLGIASVIGTGGVTIYNSQDPGGLFRVYSAQMTVVPEPASLAVIAASALLVRRHRGNRSISNSR